MKKCQRIEFQRIAYFESTKKYEGKSRVDEYDAKNKAGTKYEYEQIWKFQTLQNSRLRLTETFCSNIFIKNI